MHYNISFNIGDGTESVSHGKNLSMQKRHESNRNTSIFLAIFTVLTFLLVWCPHSSCPLGENGILTNQSVY